MFFKNHINIPDKKPVRGMSEYLPVKEVYYSVQLDKTRNTSS